jgi:hydrogenase expression/formation protein HypC
MCLAVPGKIIEIKDSPGLKMARVDFGGVLRDACIEALPEAKIGDYVIVHAGFALNILSQQEAIETLKALEQLEQVNLELDQKLMKDQVKRANKPG